MKKITKTNIELDEDDIKEAIAFWLESDRKGYITSDEITIKVSGNKTSPIIGASVETDASED